MYEFKWCSLETLFVICAALTLALSIISPLIFKKNKLSVASSIVTGLFATAYYALCIPLLYQLETMGEAGIATDSLTDSHTTYTTLFMSLIFVVALIGSALPLISRMKKLQKHAFKLFLLYAIASVASFITWGASLFSEYSESVMLIVFIPLHCVLSLTLAAVSMLDCSKLSQFVALCITTALLVVTMLAEIILMGVDFSGVTFIILIAFLSVALINVISLIYDRFYSLKSKIPPQISE